jgi:hypothetical protein
LWKNIEATIEVGVIFLEKLKTFRYYTNGRKILLVHFVVIHVKPWRTKKLKSHCPTTRIFAWRSSKWNILIITTMEFTLKTSRWRTTSTTKAPKDPLHSLFNNYF